MQARICGGLGWATTQVYPARISSPKRRTDTGFDDILEELGPLVREAHTAPDEPPVRHPAELALSDQERPLLGQLDNHPSGVNELIVRTGLTASQVLATLSVLELKRLVRRLPGHQFVRA